MTTSSSPHWPSRGSPSHTTWRFTLRKGVASRRHALHGGPACSSRSSAARRNTKLIKSFVYQDIETSEGRRLHGHGDDQAAVRLAAAHLTMLGMLPARRRRQRGRVLRQARGHRPVRFVSWMHGDHVDLRRTRSTGSPRSEGREAAVRFIPELSTRAPPCRGRDPRHRPRLAGQGVGRSRRRRHQGARHAGGRGPALALPARGEAGKDPRSGRRSRSPSTATPSSRSCCSATRAPW